MTPESFVADATGATAVTIGETVQSLWSGYGSIRRVALQGADFGSVILKHVAPPTGASHPRGWDGDRSHTRKLRSYQVESAFYQNFAAHCTAGCRVPRHLGSAGDDGERFLLLEDLDAAGFGARFSSLDEGGIDSCLKWLANFHATFMGQAPEALWPVGTYWHLDTRPDELQEMADGDLKAAAGKIDTKLNAARFQTFVHGDAKIANFCFAPDGAGVAAVDFQYIGGGCGMKDLAYFLGSCLNEEECEQGEARYLDQYFTHLRAALSSEVDADALEAEWRELYPYAWTDFHRFLLGWAPGHWKINSYSERLSRQVVAAL